MPRGNNLVLGGDTSLEKWRELDEKVDPESALCTLNSVCKPVDTGVVILPWCLPVCATPTWCSLLPPHTQQSLHNIDATTRIIDH